MSTVQATGLLALPEELLLNIATDWDVRSNVSFQKVSRAAQKIATHESVWQHYCVRDYLGVEQPFLASKWKATYIKLKMPPPPPEAQVGILKREKLLFIGFIGSTFAPQVWRLELTNSVEGAFFSSVTLYGLCDGTLKLSIEMPQEFHEKEEAYEDYFHQTLGLKDEPLMSTGLYIDFENQDNIKIMLKVIVGANVLPPKDEAFIRKLIKDPNWRQSCPDILAQHQVVITQQRHPQNQSSKYNCVHLALAVIVCVGAYLTSSYLLSDS